VVCVSEPPDLVDVLFDVCADHKIRDSRTTSMMPMMRNVFQNVLILMPSLSRVGLPKALVP
jgi:hypothetical protein